MAKKAEKTQPDEITNDVNEDEITNDVDENENDAAESTPGGRYLVNGVLVNAEGEPIKK